MNMNEGDFDDLEVDLKIAQKDLIKIRNGEYSDVKLQVNYQYANASNNFEPSEITDELNNAIKQVKKHLTNIGCQVQEEGMSDSFWGLKITFPIKLPQSNNLDVTLDGLPESIVENNGDIYVGIMMNADYSDASTVVKINPSTNYVTSTYEVGDGPTSLLVSDDKIYVARTFYDSSWNAFHGTSLIDLNLDDSVSIVNYGAGTVCGGSVHSFKGNPYRSFEGGVASLKADLTINESTLIGNYEAQNVYSVETIGDKVYVGTYDGYVKILSEDNIEISSYQVGSFPGDFEVWKK